MKDQETTKEKSKRESAKSRAELHESEATCMAENDPHGMSSNVTLEAEDEDGSRTVDSQDGPSYRGVHTNDALQKSESRYRALFENMREGVAIYRLDHDGKNFVFVDFNRAGERIDNVRKEQLIGKSLLEVFPSAGEFGLFDVLRRVWRTGIPEIHPLTEYKDQRIAGWRENFVFRLPSGEVVAIYTDETDRMRSELELRKNEQRLELALMGANLGLWDLNLQTGEQFYDERWASMLGYSVDEIEPRVKVWLELIHPEDMPGVVEAFESHLQGQMPLYETVHRLKAKSGEWKWILARGKIVERDSEGKPLRMTGTHLDITERKKTEQNYRRAADLLEALFQASPDLISVHDQDLRIVKSNWKGLDYVPLEKRKEGLHCYEVYMNRSIPCENCRALGVFETGEPQIFEDVNPIDERIREITIFPITDEAGKVVWVAEHLHDITERKRAEQGIRQSEERFRAVFESVSDCIWIKDTDFRYTHVNPAVTKLLDLPASEIIGRRAEELYGEEFGKQISERCSRVVAGESLEYEQSRLVHDVPMVFHDVCVPLRNMEGTITGVCRVSRRVTERASLREKQDMAAQRYPSSAMEDTLKMAMAAAAHSGVVLLQGESGTGKDYLARWIHDHSPRASGSFFSINCAALPKELAESELFGHERGAFTGAAVRKKGMLELAEGGTILLNEIGELAPPLQSKLLMFLDTNSFMRVGGEMSIRIDARIMAATHRDLRKEVSQGRFLEPLFYRLSVFPLDVPPLRDRLEDIPVLVEEILVKLACEMQMPRLPVIDEEHIQVLSGYFWPGNVRELRNVIERSLMLWGRGRFRIALPESKPDPKHVQHTLDYVPGKTLREAHEEVTKSLCSEALRHCQGNKTDAAKLLGISRDAFYRYIKRFGITS